MLKLIRNPKDLPGVASIEVHLNGVKRFIPVLYFDDGLLRQIETVLDVVDKTIISITEETNQKEVSTYDD